MFRVYNTVDKVWVKDNIYLSPKDELFLIKQGIFGMTKVPLLLEDYKYVWHKDIGICDKDENLIYEGDYIEANIGKVDENSEDKIEVGLVSYAPELSAYVMLCIDNDTFYTLGSNVSKDIKIIGNVFDGYEKINKNDKQTLSNKEK